MLLNEIWKDIPNYEGLYQISDLGRIKSLHWGKEKILKQTIRSKNYPYYFIGLLKDKKRKYYAIHSCINKLGNSIVVNVLEKIFKNLFNI